MVECITPASRANSIYYLSSFNWVHHSWSKPLHIYSISVQKRFYCCGRWCFCNNDCPPISLFIYTISNTIHYWKTNTPAEPLASKHSLYSRPQLHCLFRKCANICTVYARTTYHTHLWDAKKNRCYPKRIIQTRKSFTVRT